MVDRKSSEANKRFHRLVAKVLARACARLSSRFCADSCSLCRISEKATDLLQQIDASSIPHGAVKAQRCEGMRRLIVGYLARGFTPSCKLSTSSEGTITRASHKKQVLRNP